MLDENEPQRSRPDYAIIPSDPEGYEFWCFCTLKGDKFTGCDFEDIANENDVPKYIVYRKLNKKGWRAIDVRPKKLRRN